MQQFTPEEFLLFDRWAPIFLQFATRQQAAEYNRLRGLGPSEAIAQLQHLIMGQFAQQRNFVQRLLYFLDEADLDVLAKVNTIFKELVDEYRQKPLGRVYACGDGAIGQLGDGVDLQQLPSAAAVHHFVEIPARVPSLQNIVQVSCGANHTAFRSQDGVVYMCGNGDNGRLGDDITKPHSVSLPTRIQYLQNIVQVSCGSDYTVLLLQNGTVYTCGNGNYGRLGDGFTDRHVVGKPTQVRSLQNISQVSCGAMHTAFLSRNGTVYTCGWGEYGRLGDSIITRHSVGIPMQIPNLQDIVQISCGGHHTAFLSRDGTVDMCGYGDTGALGNGRLDRHSVGIPTKVPDLQGIASVHCGEEHTIFLLQDGTVYACGNGEYGRLGDGYIDDGEHFVARPTRVPDLQNIVQVSCGALHTAFLLQDGTVRTCGWSSYGRLGIGITKDRAVGIPTQVRNLQDIVQISCGSDYTAFVQRNDPDYRIGECVQCDAPASLVCSRCVDAVYCSANCQKAHWHAHSSQCY